MKHGAHSGSPFGPASAAAKEAEALRAALAVQLDRAAVLQLKTAAAIFRSRLLVATAQAVLVNVVAWREYRKRPH